MATPVSQPPKPAVILVNAHTTATPFTGGRLVVADRLQLVQLIARIMVGYHLHAEMILAGKASVSSRPTSRMVAAAVQQLAPPTSDGLRWRRDGWVFQMISWISVREGSLTRILAAPHMREGRHGFDGLFLEDVNGTVTLTVCEDKATDNSRATVQQQVFPEFASLEAGERDAELQAELTALLRQTSRSSDQIAAAIDAVQWEQQRRFRATVTAETAVANRPEALYKDYDTVVIGSVERRSGNIFVEDALRPWMDSLCADITAELQRLPVRPTKTT